METGFSLKGMFAPASLANSEEGSSKGNSKNVGNANNEAEMTHIAKERDKLYQEHNFVLRSLSLFVAITCCASVMVRQTTGLIVFHTCSGHEYSPRTRTGE